MFCCWALLDALELRYRAMGEYVKLLAVARFLKCSEDGVAAFIIVVLILWLVVTVIGFVFKGLLWLAIIGMILLIGTGAFELVRRTTTRR